VAEGTGVIPRLVLVVDRGVAGSDQALLSRLAWLWRLVPAGAPVQVQLRARDLTGGPRRRLLREARTLTRGRPDLPVLLNGSAAEALEYGFDGAHLPEALRPEDPPIPRPARLTAAVHDLKGARAAARIGVDAVLLAPIWDPGSKPGTGIGLEALARVARQSPVPVLALGGIRPERIAPALAAGAHGVAALSAPSTGDEEAVRGMIEAVG
jgi:thiamine-phosphate pyrophosphorylase